MVLFLHSSGILPLCLIALKILVSCTPQSSRCLSASVGIPSGPQLFPFFILFSCLSTSSHVTSCHGPSVSGSSLPSICCLALLSKSLKCSAHRLMFSSVFIRKGAVLCFHKVTLVVIFGCLVSRFCQPIDCFFAFSSVQFLIQLLCCSGSFNCYGSERSFSMERGHRICPQLWRIHRTIP